MFNLSIPNSTLPFLGVFFVLIVGVCATTAFSRDLYRLPCKKLPEGITRKQIVADFEKYRLSEENILDGGPLGNRRKECIVSPAYRCRNGKNFQASQIVCEAESYWFV